jgi:hypothetical protein
MRLIDFLDEAKRVQTELGSVPNTELQKPEGPLHLLKRKLSQLSVEDRPIAAKKLMELIEKVNQMQ